MAKCEYCGSVLRDKYLLKKHQSVVMKCLKIQHELKLLNKTDKQQLDIDKQQLELDRQKLELERERLELDKKQYEFNKKSNNLGSNNLNSNNSISNNSVSITNVYQTAINMVPLTDEHFKKFSGDLILSDLMGADAYAQYMVDYPLKDQAYVKNLRDKKVVYKNAEGKLAEDIGGYGILKNITYCHLDQIFDMTNSKIDKLLSQLEELQYDDKNKDKIMKRIKDIKDVQIACNNMSSGKDCKFKDKTSRKLVKLLASVGSGITTT